MIEHRCKVCERGGMRRSERRGLIERFILPVLGLYPWRCGFCRNRVQLSDRGPERQYFSSEKRSSRRSKHRGEQDSSS